MNNYLKYGLFLFVLFMVQVFFLNGLRIHPTIHPSWFVFAIVFIPFSWSVVAKLIFAFCYGFLFDLIAGTPGLNAAITTLMAYLINYYIKNKESDLGSITGFPDISYLGFVRFFAILFFISLLFHGLQFAFVVTIRNNFIDYLLLVFVSSVFALALFLVYYLLNPLYSNEANNYE